MTWWEEHTNRCCLWHDQVEPANRVSRVEAITVSRWFSLVFGLFPRFDHLHLIPARNSSNFSEASSWLKWGVCIGKLVRQDICPLSFDPYHSVERPLTFRSIGIPIAPYESKLPSLSVERFSLRSASPGGTPLRSHTEKITRGAVSSTRIRPEEAEPEERRTGDHISDPCWGGAVRDSPEGSAQVFRPTQVVFKSRC